MDIVIDMERLVLDIAVNIDIDMSLSADMNMYL